jgi:hypothetical protein
MMDGRAYAASPDLWIVFDALLARFAERGLFFVTVYRGDGAPEEAEITPRIEARGLEAAVMWGGQPHYPLLLSAE